MVAARRISGGKSEGGGDRKDGDEGEGRSGMGDDKTAAVAAAEEVAACGNGGRGVATFTRVSSSSTPCYITGVPGGC